MQNFSVQPLRPLCLCGCFFKAMVNYRDTEDAEVAQRRIQVQNLLPGRFRDGLPARNGCCS